METGEKLVYLKNPKYKPGPSRRRAWRRQGGELDRVEWVWISDFDTQTQCSR